EGRARRGGRGGGGGDLRRRRHTRPGCDGRRGDGEGRHGRVRYRRAAAAAAATLAVAVGLTGCKSTTALEQEYVSTDIVVGSGTSTESRIVAAVYAEALRGTGIGVSTDLGVGDRFDYVRALQSGRISV